MVRLKTKIINNQAQAKKGLNMMADKTKRLVLGKMNN